MGSAVRVILVDPNATSRRELERLLAGAGPIVLAEACCSYRDAVEAAVRRSADLVIVHLSADREAAIALIGAFTRDRPGTAVLPVSPPCNSDVILKVMRAGAREFLLLPATSDELLQAIDRLLAPVSAASTTGIGSESRIIAVAGATGGVGCTTLAVNLAVELARDADHEVVLADLDLLLGAVDVCLDLTPEHTLLDVARDVERLDPTLLRRSLTKHASGLYVLPKPPAMEDAARVEPDAVSRILTNLKRTFPTVVADLSKGFQPTDVIALELAEIILLVVVLEPACLRNTAKLLEMMRREGDLASRVRVVVNRAGSGETEVGTKKAEEILKASIACEIPFAPKLFDSARSKGVTLGVEASGSRPHRALRQVARTLALGSLGADGGRSRFSRIAALFF